MHCTTKVILLFVVIALVVVNASPSRTRRQSDNVDEDFQINLGPPRRPSRPSRPSRPTTTTTPANPVDGTTTTTASPQYTACMNACQTTNQYNPVCGSDRVSYMNEGRLRCAVRCGKRIQLLFRGNCEAL